MQGVSEVEREIERLKEITEKLRDADLGQEQTLELLKQCTQSAAHALEQLEQIAGSLDSGEQG